MWLGRYRSYFHRLVAKVKNLPSLCKNDVVDKNRAFWWPLLPYM
jgi:hypothetical protein